MSSSLEEKKKEKSLLVNVCFQNNSGTVEGRRRLLGDLDHISSLKIKAFKLAADMQESAVSEDDGMFFFRKANVTLHWFKTSKRNAGNERAAFSGDTVTVTERWIFLCDGEKQPARTGECREKQAHTHTHL